MTMKLRQETHMESALQDTNSLHSWLAIDTFMNITTFISVNREKALSLGDYDSYRSQCSRRLKKLRQKLQPTTSKNTSYKKKAKVEAVNVAQNVELIQLLLLTAERAWADGMHLRSVRSADSTKTITGSTRQHVLSRLSKAAKQAQDLALLFQDPASQASDKDILEVWAYAYSLMGSVEFEKQSSGSRKVDGQIPPKQRWKMCLVAFSGARVIYDSVSRSSKQQDVYKELLNTTVDPSIRYAAYQSRLSRNLAASTIARQNFPRDNKALLAVVEKFDPKALSEEPTSKEVKPADASAATINWRGRTVTIADASISQALSTVSAAENYLVSSLSSNKRRYRSSLKVRSVAYDDLLSASLDAADAVRHAIEELERERVDEGDSRMQDLRVTSLAVNYSLVGWRIGRNRVLMGEDDGIRFAGAKMRKPRRRGKRAGNDEDKNLKETSDGNGDGDGNDKTTHINTTKVKLNEERQGRKLARLHDRIALYDAILQSIDSIKELRGALRDESFVAELDGKRAYFQALKCLNISHTHALTHHYAESLALTTRAQHLCKLAQSKLSSSSSASSTSSNNSNGNFTQEKPASSPPPSLRIPTTNLTTLSTHLASTSLYYQAMHTLAQQFAEEAEQAAKINQTPTTTNTATKSNIAQQAPSGPSPGSDPEPSKSQAPIPLPLDLALRRFNPAGTRPDAMMTYPPTNLVPVPLKPIVLDVAWNYVDYDDVEKAAGGKGKGGVERGGGVAQGQNRGVRGVQEEGGKNMKKKKKGEVEEEEEEEEEEEKGTAAGASSSASASASTGKRGWFGFGRG